jgi:hypothetical protein
MATMSIPARQLPQNQGDAAAVGTDFAENEARSGALLYKLFLPPTEPTPMMPHRIFQPRLLRVAVAMMVLP